MSRSLVFYAEGVGGGLEVRRQCIYFINVKQGKLQLPDKVVERLGECVEREGDY